MVPWKSCSQPHAFYLWNILPQKQGFLIRRCSAQSVSWLRAWPVPPSFPFSTTPSSLVVNQIQVSAPCLYKLRQAKKKKNLRIIFSLTCKEAAPLRFVIWNRTMFRIIAGSSFETLAISHQTFPAFLSVSSSLHLRCVRTCCIRRAGVFPSPFNEKQG